MARALKFALVAATLALLALCATASLVKPLVPPPMPSPPATVNPDPANRAEAIYRLMDKLIRVAEERDYNKLNDLVDDNFMGRITGMGCGYINKSTFIDTFRSAGIKSETVAIRGFVESSGLGVFALTAVGVIEGRNGGNDTVFNAPLLYASIIPSADFQKIVAYEQFEDRSLWQSNATAMVGVFSTLINAVQARDITPWQSTLAEEFLFQLWQPYTFEQPLVHNRTSFLDTLQQTFAMCSSETFLPLAVFASCEYVIAEFNWAGIAKEGAASKHFFFSMRLSSDMQVNMINEFPAR